MGSLLTVSYDIYKVDTLSLTGKVDLCSETGTYMIEALRHHLLACYSSYYNIHIADSLRSIKHDRRLSFRRIREDSQVLNQTLATYTQVSTRKNNYIVLYLTRCKATGTSITRSSRISVVVQHYSQTRRYTTNHSRWHLEPCIQVE